MTLVVPTQWVGASGVAAPLRAGEVHRASHPGAVVEQGHLVRSRCLAQSSLANVGQTTSATYLEVATGVPLTLSPETAGSLEVAALCSDCDVLVTLTDGTNSATVTLSTASTTLVARVGTFTETWLTGDAELTYDVELRRQASSATLDLLTLREPVMTAATLA